MWPLIVSVTSKHFLIRLPAAPCGPSKFSTVSHSYYYLYGISLVYLQSSGKLSKVTNSCHYTDFHLFAQEVIVTISIVFDHGKECYLEPCVYAILSGGVA